MSRNKPLGLPLWLRRTMLALLPGFVLLASVVLTGGTAHARQAATTVIADCVDDSQLQNAVSNASSGDAITFGCSGDIILSRTLTIATNLTLDGSGQNVSLDGANRVRVIFVNNGVDFTLNALTIAHGNGNIGGGLYNNTGTVSINNSTFDSNQSASEGGGFYNGTGIAGINNSIFTNNSSVEPGGGLFNAGAVLITNSTFSNNSVLIGGGGGIYNVGAASIGNSTFSNNSAPRGGGGYNNGGNATFTNSTFANNSAFGDGGGFYNDTGGIVTINNSTFSSNSSTTGSGGSLFNVERANINNSTFANNSAGNLGGAFNNTKTLNISGSIVANNKGGGGNCAGSGTNDQGYNLSNDDSCGLTASTSQQNTDPLLASSLASNGGPTQTLSLQANSPAIDKIPAIQCPITDQRGTPRLDNGESFCDSGAYEFSDPVDKDLALTGLPANMTVNAAGAQGAVVTYTSPTATDEAGDNPGPSVACTPTSGNTFAIGTTTVTCTASDSDDTPGTVNSSFTVTVQDQLSPTLSLPTSPVMVDATSPQGAVVNYTVTATDPVYPASQLTIACTPTAGSMFAIGSTTVHCSASDPAGNTTSGSFQVMVNGATTQISNLIKTVNSFHFKKSIQTSLDLELQVALVSLQHNKPRLACAALNLFRLEVTNFTGHGITSSQASQLLAAARQIQAVIGC